MKTQTIIIVIIIILFLVVTVFVNNDPVVSNDGSNNVCSTEPTLNNRPKQTQAYKPQKKVITPSSDTAGLSKITDRLWVSDYPTSTNYEDLKVNGIKQILSVGIELPAHETNDFKLMHIRIADQPSVNIRKHFDETYKFIDTAPTLVHCAAGVSRSVSIVLAYLIRKERMPLQQALALVRSKRPIVRPNYGFIQQLEAFEKEYVR